MLYHTNHLYYPTRNKGIDLFVVSILKIVTGIYDSRWRSSSRSFLPVKNRKYNKYKKLNAKDGIQRERHKEVDPSI